MKMKKIKGKKAQVEIFCYECKRYIPVTPTKEMSAEQVFKNGGHYGDPVPFLAPNLGRVSHRYERSIQMKLAKEAATGG